MIGDVDTKPRDITAGYREQFVLGEPRAGALQVVEAAAIGAGWSTEGNMRWQ